MSQPAAKQPKQPEQPEQPKQPKQPEQPKQPKQPERPKQMVMRMQTGMDGLNFEEYYALNQNFEEIKKELAQIVQQ